MSNPPASASRGPPFRSSHLRKFSMGSSITGQHGSANSGVEATGSPANLSSWTKISNASVRRLCSLWIHDESFSTEDVVVNLSQFPTDYINIGDLMQIVAIDESDKDTVDGNKIYSPSSDRVKKKDSLRDGEVLSPVSMATSSGIQGIPHFNELHFDPSKRHVFVVKKTSPEQNLKQPGLQVSVSTHIATRIGFKNRSSIVISAVDEPINRASHVEITFRDEYLTRADMWGLVVARLANKTIYKNQRITFMGTIKVLIKTIFVQNGQKVQSAFFDASTKPIFRSESARYVLFIQMSKEMWDFDADGTGEIMFSKVINGFLPELFKRWGELGVKHLVSIVLFTRLEYERGLAADFVHAEMDASDNSLQDVIGKISYKDYYRVVVSDLASSEWASILSQLKAEFKVFLRDVSIRKPSGGQYLSLGTGLTTSTDLPTHIIAGHPSAAVRGNILEAINLASSQFSCDHIDRDLVRTGISISVITASTGVFEVDYKSLVKTTENLIENGVGIDLVCLSRMPLHSVPLFKYWQEEPQPRESRAGFNESNEQRRYEAIQSYSDGIRHDSVSQWTSRETSFTSPSIGLKSLKAGHWKYGIPHWIDVSFWTSSSDEDRTQAAILGKLRNKADPIKRQQKSFVPRLRLYELQMMGVMEDAKISIPYLSRYTRTSSNSHQSHRESRNSSQVARQDFGDYKNVTQKFVDLSSKGSMNTRIHEHGFQNTQWMDEYDDIIFRHPRERRSTLDSRRIWKNRPLSHISRNQRRRDYSPLRLGSSPSAHSSSVDGRSGLEGKVLFDPAMKSRQSTQTHGHKRGSIASIISSSNSSPKKPTQLSRQISFGPRGFSGTLKAHPSTELSAEHANSASLLSRGFRSTSSSKAKNNSITPESRLAQSRSTNSQVSVNLSPDQQENLDGLIVPYSISPRPIPIRQVTTLRHVKEDMIKMPEEKDAVLDIFFNSGNMEEQSASSRQETLNDGYDFPKNPSPGSSMAPWLTILNPSNPHKTDNTLGGQLGRWQHVFPHPLRTSKIKWKSLCSPAAVPLTTEEYPSADQIAEEYQESQYCVAPLEEANLLENPRSQDWLLREMMAFRFSHGFQIVIGSKLAQTFGLSPVQTIDVFEENFSFERGSTIFMLKGGTIHQLSYIDGGGIDVRNLTRRTMSSRSSENSSEFYKPAIRTMLAEEYISQEIDIFPTRKDVDWETLDSFIAGREKPQAEQFADTLHSWRARFVLIPVDPPSSGRRPLHPINEDDEEEVRLEGIRKLTQVWQRFRYVPSTERRFQSSTRKRKDTNPLDIMYRTLDPSAIVAAELDSIGENNPAGRPIQLLPESDLFQRSNINLVALAQAIQSERGVRMMDRRWHWRLHYNCFIGFELTTWILQYFRDVETREEAVEIGNDLMSRGLFQHVEQRHNFRDGNFFYQIASEYRAPRPESSRNWFGSRKADKSVPSTPMSESTNEDSPKLPRSRASSTGEGHSDAEMSTPTDSKHRLGVTLSKSLLYDVDHRRRSHRPEVVNLHYDRLHNPDNCYHICIEWMNVTAKLIEDAIVSWATLVDRFGLRLVELPLGEAAAIRKMHPFRAPYLVKLAQYPPGKQPQTFLDATSFATQDRMEKHFYQKAIMKRFNFVLDFEAAKDFPPDVDVTYSWGKPDYQYPQYIHRSGVLLAQITDDGDILLLANRLYNNRSAPGQEPVRTDGTENQIGSGRTTSARGGNHRGSPRASPHLSPSFRATQDMPSSSTGFARSGQTTAFSTPEQISKDFEAFCQDAVGLSHFYSEVLKKSSSPSPNTPFMESSIPALGLPPSLSLQEGSPTPRGSGTKAKTGSNSSPKVAVADSGSGCDGDQAS